VRRGAFTTTPRSPKRHRIQCAANATADRVKPLLSRLTYQAKIVLECLLKEGAPSQPRTATRQKGTSANVNVTR
jgi:hypothetical protein